jgi:dihydroxyacetone kinase
MKKIINAPESFVDEVIDGILRAHPDQLASASADNRALVRAQPPRPGTVGIVTGGGSGHIPLFLGYVGHGLCSGVAVGNVFSSPSATQILAATTASDSGAGVLYLYGNYGGDVFNFDLAADLAEAQGIQTATVLGADDVASAPRERAETRRGVAGIFFGYKIAGAAAERGDDLAAVAAIAQRAVNNTGTMGVGLSPTILPTAGKPSFELPDGEMEIGIGIHGEPGSLRGPLETADQITDRLLNQILADLGLGEGPGTGTAADPGSTAEPEHAGVAERANAAADSSVAVLVNGMGATPPEELYLMFRRVAQTLDGLGVRIHRSYVGEYATSLEMAGASISIIKLDDELAELLDAPATSPFFRQ